MGREDDYEMEDVTCIKATEKALLITSPDLGDDEEWVPLSQVSDDSEVMDEGDEGTLIVTNWIAEQKGWV